MDFLLGMVAIVGGVIGMFTTLYLFFSIPVVIVWKFYRKKKYNKSLFD